MNPWKIATIVCLGWALVTTGLWLRARRGPDSVVSPILASEPGVSALERIAFAQQFQERLLNYDQANFAPGQTALTFLMAEPLRQRQLADLSERAGSRQREFQQTARLSRLRSRGENGVTAAGRLKGREESATWELEYEVDLELEPLARSIENPWGWQVRELAMRTRSKSEESRPTTTPLALSTTSPTILSFPCFVQNIQTPKDLPVRIKLTSMNVSEVQLHRTEGRLTPTVIEARCADRVFPLALSEGTPEDSFDLRVELDEKDGLAKKVADRLGKKSEAYERNLEAELGFVVEE